MTRINGILQPPQRILVPEQPRSKINTPLIRACCNAFLLTAGAEQCESYLGKKALGKKRKKINCS